MAAGLPWRVSLIAALGLARDSSADSSAAAASTVSANSRLVDSFGSRLAGLQADSSRAMVEAARSSAASVDSIAARSADVVDGLIGANADLVRATQRSFADATAGVERAYADAKGTPASFNPLLLGALAVAGIAVTIALVRR